jgi:hypothetical protein
MDGGDAGAVLRGLTEVFRDGRATVIAAPAAPAAGPAMLLPPAAKKRRVVRRGGKQAAAVIAVSAEAPLTVSGVIRAAIEAGPKTNQDVADYVEARGLKPGSQTVSTLLCQMRKRNEIYKDDRDLRWHQAIQPPKK